MKGSETSWSIEDLVDRMEELQSLNEILEQENIQKDEQIQQLSSEISDLRSTLLTLKNQLLEKSETIVKQKGADLILAENEQLKAKDRQLVKEISDIKSRAEKAVRACNEKHESYKQSMEFRLKKHSEDLEDKYRTDIKENTSLLIVSLIYSLLVTFVFISKSDTLRNDLADIFGFFKDIFYHTIEIGECAAQIFIDIPIVGDMLFASVTCLISVAILAIEGLIVCFLLKVYIVWYQKVISDEASFLTAVATFLLTLFFADEIRSVIPINVVIINLLSHVTFVACKLWRLYASDD